MPATPGAGEELRPLTLGEILDRAVTLSVRYFWPLATLYVVYAVPLGVERYASRDNGFFSYLLDLFNHAAAVDRAAPATRGNWPLVDLLLSYLLSAVPSGALAYAIAERYVGRAAGFGRAYLVALQRLPSLVGLVLPYLVIYFALLAAGLLAIVALALAASLAGALHALSPGVLLFVAVPAAVPFAVAICALIVAQWSSLASLVVEDFDFWPALRAGLRRAFSRSTVRRTFAVACAYFAAVAGFTLVGIAAHSALADSLHNDVLDEIFQTLADIVSTVFLSTFLTIYYFDLRVRAEAFDLRLAAQQTVS